MRIAVVSTFYSEGMGYTENCLPKALAARGHDVHLLASTFNVYGDQADYAATYGDFLGPSVVSPGTTRLDGYQVHRLTARVVGGYVMSTGLAARIREIAPDVVHSLEIASLQTYQLALQRLLQPVCPVLRDASAHVRHQAVPATPRWPRSEGCLSTDAHVADASRQHGGGDVLRDRSRIAPRSRQPGVPPGKIKLQSLGADTDVFHPAETDADRLARTALRTALGFRDDDIVCVYTGRFSQEKNPLALARAIDLVSDRDPRFKGLFIGRGAQSEEIAARRHTTIVSFMRHRELAEHYRASDIAVWPTQESMSMLDAASTGLPLVVSNTVGEAERVKGSGRMYVENDVHSLAEALIALAAPDEERALGAVGRQKMLDGFNWAKYAMTVEADYRAALRRMRSTENHTPAGSDPR